MGQGGERIPFREWYDALAKPGWTPEPAFIGLMWQIIYPILFATVAFVFVQALRGTIPKNLVANLIFTPIQFGLRNLPLATVDILVIWGSIIWMSVVVWKHYRWVAVAQLPYFAWVSVATVLQTSVTWMNR